MAVPEDTEQSQPFLRLPVSVLGLLAVLAIGYAAEALAPPQTYFAIIRRFAFFPSRYSAHYIKRTWLRPRFAARPRRAVCQLHVPSWQLDTSADQLRLARAVRSDRCAPFRRPAVLCFLPRLRDCGRATFLAFNWGSNDPVVGASGAISGLMAVGFRMLRYPFVPKVRTVPWSQFSRPESFSLSLLWVAINIVAGVTGLGAGPGPQVIAWQAHLGGYAAGLVLAGPFLALRNRMMR